MSPLAPWTRAGSRTSGVWAGVVIVAALAAGAAHLTRGHAWGDDFASYVMQARAIWVRDVDGFLEHNAFTILRSSHRLGPVAYPWGYPLLLVPSYAISGLDPIALKLPGLLLFGAFLVVLYLLARTALDPLASLLVLLLFALHPQLLAFLDHVLSDVPFLFLSTLALLLLVRLESGPPAGVARGALLGAVVFAAYLTRTAGVLLLMALAVVEGWRAWGSRSGREASRARPVLAVFLAFGLLWAVARMALPGGQAAYLEQLRGTSPAVAWTNAGRYLRDAGGFFTGGDVPAWGVAVLALVGAVGAANRRRQDAILLVYLALTIVVVCAWPEHQGLRFLFPILPVLAIFLVAGLRDVLSWAAPGLARTALVVACVGWIAVVGLRDAVARIGPDAPGPVGGPFAERSLELFRFVREGTRPGSVVVFFKPRAMRLMTGRDAIQATDCDRLRQGDYVILRRWAPGGDELTPEGLLACGVDAEVVFENADFVARRTRR